MSYRCKVIWFYGTVWKPSIWSLWTFSYGATLKPVKFNRVWNCHSRHSVCNFKVIAWITRWFNTKFNMGDFWTRRESLFIHWHQEFAITRQKIFHLRVHSPRYRLLTRKGDDDERAKKQRRGGERWSGCKAVHQPVVARDIAVVWFGWHD
jgi:hypothetical protein